MPEGKETSIEAYIRSVHDAEGKDRVPPHTKAGEKTLIKEPITKERLDEIEKSITSDNLIGSYEELSALRETMLEQLRLQQTGKGVESEQLKLTEYRLNAIILSRRLIVENKETLRRYRETQKNFEKTGLASTLSPEVESAANDHVVALSAAIGERVALGQLALLLDSKAKGKNISDEVLAAALSNAPSTVKLLKTGVSRKIDLDKGALEKMKPADAYQALVNAIQMAEENVLWLLSYAKEVPGVRPDLEGINPIDVLYTEYLADIMKEVSMKELEIAKQPDFEAALVPLRKFRETLLVSIKENQQRLQLRAIENLKDASVGFVDTSYAVTGKEEEPYLFPKALLETNPENRGDTDRQVKSVIGGFRTRSRMILGGKDEKGNVIKGIFERSVLDSKDWGLYKEDVYKKHSRFKVVYPVLDSLARMQVVPDVVGRWAVRTGAKGVMDKEALDVSFPEKTFHAESEKAMVHIRKAWKLPENITVDGKTVPFSFYEPAHWDALSPEQWEAIKDSQQSTLDALDKQKEKTRDSLNAIEGDLQGFESLYALKNPDEMVGIMPDDDTFGDLQSGKTTLGELLLEPDKLKANPTQLAACYFYVFVQMQEHAGKYSEVTADTQSALKHVADNGIDAAKEISEAGRNVKPPYWFFGLMGVLGVWYLSAIPRSGSPRMIRALGTMANDTYRLSRFGYRQTVGRLSRLSKTPAAINPVLAGDKNVAALEAKIAKLTAELKDSVPGADASKLAAEKLSLQAELAGAKSEVVSGAETLRSVKTENAALKTGRYNSLEERASALSREIDEAMDLADPAARRTALDAGIERAKLFQKEANALEELMPGARRSLAESVLGKNIVSDPAWEVVEQMHKASSLEDKVRILVNAELPPEQSRALKKLLRMGIAGETDEALRLTESLSPATKTFLKGLNGAEAAGESMGRLVARTPVNVLDDAARVSEQAARLQKAARAAKASGYVMKGCIALEVFVDAYLLYENRERMAQAEKDGDQDTLRILKDREYSLVLASAGGLSTFALSSWSLAGPAAIALAGGTWYAEELYDHAIQLNKGTVENYLKIPSSQLLQDIRQLRNFEVAEIATGKGKESREIRRMYMLEALLRKRIRVAPTQKEAAVATEWFEKQTPEKQQELIKKHGSPQSVVRWRLEGTALAGRESKLANRAMAVVDYATSEGVEKRGKYDLLDPLNTSRGMKGVDILSGALEITALYSAKDELVGRGQEPVVTFRTGGRDETIDLRTLPPVLSGKRTSDNAERMMELALLARKFDRYRLQQMRSQYLAMGEIGSAMKENSSQGWIEAGDAVRPLIYERMAPAIIHAENKVSNAFTGMGFDVYRDAALFELRILVQRLALSYMQVMMNEDNSFEVLEKHEANCRRTLMTVDAHKLFEGAQTKDMGAADFNTLKYSLDGVEKQVNSVSGIINIHRFGADEMLTQPVLAARKNMEGRLGGIPLQYCVSNLIDR